MRNPFRRQQGFILGSGHFLGRPPRDVTLAELNAEYASAGTDSERRELDARIASRLRELNESSD